MISVQDLVKLGKEDPKAAHRMVAEMAGQRVHENFRSFKGRQSCIQKAMQKPLPGNAGDAFLASNMTVNGRTIYNVVPTHIKILQALDSPLLKMAARAEDEKNPNEEFTEEQQWEMCYLFTTPPRILRMLFKERGIEVIKSESEKVWGDKTSAEITVTATAAIIQYARHIRTTVEYTQEMEASGDKSFFRELAEKASRPKA